MNEYNGMPFRTLGDNLGAVGNSSLGVNDDKSREAVSP